jgi:hypothetical protein
MGLRLFLVSFLTGICSVLFALVLVSVFFGSSQETAGATNQTDNAGALSSETGPSPVATQVSEPTPPLPSPTPNPTGTPEPSQVPEATEVAVPVPTNPPSRPGSPVPPSGLVATYIGGEGVVLTWDPVAGAGYYNIYRSELPGGGDRATYSAIGSSGTTSVRDSSVQPGVAYYYVVTASAAGVESNSSNEAAVIIPAP